MLPSLVSTEVLVLQLLLLHNHQPRKHTFNFIVASRLAGSTGCAVVSGSAQIPRAGELSECLQRRLAMGMCDVAGPPASWGGLPDLRTGKAAKWPVCPGLRRGGMQSALLL